MSQIRPRYLRLYLVLFMTLIVPFISNAQSSNSTNQTHVASQPAGGNLQSSKFSFSSVIPTGGLGTWIDVVSVEITTSGKPVFVGVVPEVEDTTKDIDGFTVRLSAVAPYPAPSWQIWIIRDSLFRVEAFQPVVGVQYPFAGVDAEIPFNLFSIDTPPAGKHTYQIRIKGNSPGSLEIKQARIVVYEL